MSVFTKAAGPSGKFLKFPEVGTSHTIQITEKYTERQQREVVHVGGGKYQQGEPKTYKSGDPMLEYVIPGLDYNAESEEDAPSVLVVKQGRQMKAIGKALLEAGAADLEVGGVLTLTFTGYGQGANPQNPPKEYEASYAPPQPSGSPWGGEDGDED